jgi:hypothetical protein
MSKPTGITISFTSAELAWLTWMTSNVMHEKMFNRDCIKFVLAADSARRKIEKAAETIAELSS